MTVVAGFRSRLRFAGVCWAAWPTSRRSWPPSSRATRTPRPSCSRSSTTSCASSPPRSWPTRSRARPSSRPPWSTRPTSGWSAATRPSTGTAAATSSPPPPRPCAASSSRPPAARAGGSAAAGWPARDLDEDRPGRRRRPPTTCSPWTRPSAGWPRPTRQAAELVKLRFFAGLPVPEAAADPRHLPPHGRPALGLRPGLAPPGGRRRAVSPARPTFRHSKNVA